MQNGALLALNKQPMEISMNDETVQVETNVVTKPKNELQTVRDQLEKMKPQFEMALPKHITPERMLRVALTACQQTPKLLDCDRKSLFSAIMRAAQLGLEPDGILGQAHLIPYGNQVQFIPGYKGLIDLARRSGEVSNIIAKEVYSNDEFTVDFSQEIPFVHKPLLTGERGAVTHFWAMARFKDGGFHWDFMTKEEVEKIRDGSSGKNNQVWRNHFIEMGKKTVIRRIAKYLPMSVQKAALVNDLVDAGKKFHNNEFGEIIIEGDANIVSEQIESKESGNEAVKDKIKKRSTANDAPVLKDGVVVPVDLNQYPTQVGENDAQIAVPEFDINKHNLKTQVGITEAVRDLCATLAFYPGNERASVFLQSGGNDLLSAISRAGLGKLKQHFITIGIKLDASEVAA